MFPQTTWPLFIFGDQEEIQMTMEWNSVVPSGDFGYYLLREYKLILLSIQEKYYGKLGKPNHIDCIPKKDLKYLNCL